MELMENYFGYDSPIGELHIIFEGEILSYLSLLRPEIKEYSKVPTKAFERLKTSLDRYFKGEIVTFDIPYKIKGSSFKKRVLEEVAMVSYGQVRSYRDIAKILEAKYHQKVSYQAIGQALKHNDLMIVIPCHRIIKSNGQIGGFMGEKTSDVKVYLLDLEREALCKKTS